MLLTFHLSNSFIGPKQTRKPDDTELRTVFVTNVSMRQVFFIKYYLLIMGHTNISSYIQIHFAASKESVAAHFVSCGEIGRIVMLTDGATGQPKG